MPTKEELLELGKRAYERQERDKLLTKAHGAAVKKLIAAHKEEFSTYLDGAKRELGL